MIFNSILTEHGVVSKNFIEVREILKAKWQGIYGDINLDQNTQDGQLIGILAQIIVDKDNELLRFLSLLNPSTSLGIYLDIIASIRGIKRSQGYPTIIKASIKSNTTKTLPQGAIITDNGNEYQIDQAVEVSASAVEVFATAQVVGKLEISGSGNINDIDITSVTTSIQWEGESIETDENFRKRILDTNIAGNTDYSLSNITRSLNIPLVIDAYKIENTKDIADTITGLPAHSVNWVFIGGSDVDCAMFVAYIKCNGIQSHGANSGIVEITQPNGVVENKTFYFDRAVPIDLQISIQTKPRSRLNLVVDTNAIKTAIATKFKSYRIGESAVYSDIVCYIQDEFPDVQVVQGGIKFASDSDYLDSRSPGLRQYITCNVSNMVIT